jgi:sugar phosphate isomerase/epimerase
MLPYCLNIHRGETLSDLYQAIGNYACAVKEQLAPETPYPLGLRFPASATDTFTEKEERLAFADFLKQRGLTSSMINGFPYGTFHGSPVKTSVYLPDWSMPERLEYTAKLALLLVDLLPENGKGSISTLPLAYQKPVLNEQKRHAAVRQLLVLACLLDELRQEHGKEIVVAIEPEPDCMLEDTHSTITWFENELLVEARRWLTANKKRSPEEAEALVRRHLGLCFDTCHFALAFEEPLDALTQFENAGISIARIQLSAALHTQVSPESLEALRAFVEPVYLHQTRIRLPRGKIIYYPDLTPETLADAAQHQGADLRTHFHVPLFWEGNSLLRSTQETLTLEFFKAVAKKGYPMELETYTFDVLPPELKASSVVENLVKETRWALAKTVF